MSSVTSAFRFKYLHFYTALSDVWHTTTDDDQLSDRGVLKIPFICLINLSQMLSGSSHEHCDKHTSFICLKYYIIALINNWRETFSVKIFLILSLKDTLFKIFISVDKFSVNLTTTSIQYYFLHKMSFMNIT